MNHIKDVDDFFKKYRIDEFYAQQKKISPSPIEPFNRKRHRKLSFGIIPGFRNYDLFYERYRSGVEILKKEGAIKDGHKILDIGSGEGFFKFFFDSMCEEKIEWHGVEVWKERAALCRHLGYNIQEVSLEKGDLPYDDASMDLVLASHVIEHLPNPQRIVSEMGRVLKPGGMLLIGTPTKPPIIADLDSWYHRLSHRNEGDTQQAFTHNSLERMLLESLGWKKDTVVDKRGFRIISGRKKLPIENWEWFYQMSINAGQKCLSIVPEVNVILKKPL